MSDQNLTELLPELRRPFSVAAVKIKPQVVTKDQSKGLVTFYIDSRLLVERLNAVVGAAGWTDSYRLLAEGEFAVKYGLPIECALTVCGVTKVDVGQLVPGEMDDKAWKSAYSDAFKRAGVKFGVGAYLYNLPQVWAATKINPVNNKAQGFSDEGAKVARAAYTKWLGTPANIYGASLDHGDVIADDVVDEPVEKPDSLVQFEGLLGKCAATDPDPGHTHSWYLKLADAAAKREFGESAVAELDGEQLAQLATKFQEHLAGLAGSVGETAAAGTDGPSGAEANGDTPDAPTDNFVAPTTRRKKATA